MKVEQRLWKVAIKSLRRRQGRSLLTSLGIIIGTVTIAIIVGIGAGSQEDIERQYSNLSATTIFINPANENGSAVSKTSIDDKPLLLSGSTYITSAVPQVSARAVVSYTTKSESVSVVGTTPDFEDSLGLTLISGDYYTEADEEMKAKKVVLGYSVAETLFGDPGSATGQSVLIEKRPYEIIGVIAYRGGAVGKIAIDDSVFGPLNTVQRYIAGSSAKMTYILQASSVTTIPMAIEDASRILREAHDLKPSEADDFKLKDMGSLVSSAISSAQTMTILLASVAIIVLIVGGIGIMNIMYVSVEERTKEIGIRKAVGAKSSHVRMQFLFEAGLLSVLAAISGVVFAYLIIVFTGMLGYTIPVVWWGFALAFFSSAIIGVFFGWYPANKAANLEPIEALRHE